MTLTVSMVTTRQAESSGMTERCGRHDTEGGAAVREWEAFIPEEERRIFEKAGFHHRQPFGERPALIVVDVLLSFTGSESRPVMSAIDEFSTSCGASAWETLPRIRKLLDACREAQIPIVFSTLSAVNKFFCGDTTKEPKTRAELARRAAPVHPDLAPRPDEFQLEKTKASVFFSTPLSTYLANVKADCLLICGTTTSGCVRATCIDGWSHGYPVFLVEDACFDRSRFFHLATLYDLNAKYVNVITLAEAEANLQGLRARAAR